MTDERNALYAWTVSQPVDDHSWMRHLPKWSQEDWSSEFRRDDTRLLRHQKRELDHINALRLQAMQPEMPDSGPPGSRGTAGGTSNYVIFDDSLIEILRKYGLAGLMAGGAGLAADQSTADAKPAN